MVDEEKLKWFNRQHLARLIEDRGRMAELVVDLQGQLNRTDLSTDYLARCIKLMSVWNERVPCLLSLTPIASCHIYQGHCARCIVSIRATQAIHGSMQGVARDLAGA